MRRKRAAWRRQRLAAQVAARAAHVIEAGLSLQHAASAGEEADVVERAYRKFHEMQIEYEMDACDFADQKLELREKLNNLKEELDGYLAREYGIDRNNCKVFKKWQESHQPFHWFSLLRFLLRS